VELIVQVLKTPQPLMLLNGGLLYLGMNLPLIDQLALSWNAVKLQTNWSLEPVFSYCDGEPNHPQISPACNQPSQLPGDRELADVQITNPGAPDISMSSQSSETPQSTSTNQAPDGTQLN